MRSIESFSGLGVALLFLCLSAGVSAQDPAVVNAKTISIKLENALNEGIALFGLVLALRSGPEEKLWVRAQAPSV
jgi:hypothetical protein